MSTYLQQDLAGWEGARVVGAASAWYCHIFKANVTINKKSKKKNKQYQLLFLLVPFAVLLWSARSRSFALPRPAVCAAAYS